MQAYAAVARINRPTMRLALAGRVAAGLDAGPSPVAPGDPETLEDLAGEPAFARFRSRWRDWREDMGVAWRQTTFFLFDPESWR